jgi:hypothetical protein
MSINDNIRYRFDLLARATCNAERTAKRIVEKGERYFTSDRKASLDITSNWAQSDTERIDSRRHERCGPARFALHRSMCSKKSASSDHQIFY